MDKNFLSVFTAFYKQGKCPRKQQLLPMFAADSVVKSAETDFNARFLSLKRFCLI